MALEHTRKRRKPRWDGTPTASDVVITKIDGTKTVKPPKITGVVGPNVNKHYRNRWKNEIND